MLYSTCHTQRSGYDVNTVTAKHLLLGALISLPCRRGLLLGCMVAAGLGTQMVSSAYRGRADFVDFSLGGTAACTLLGLSRE